MQQQPNQNLGQFPQIEGQIPQRQPPKKFNGAHLNQDDGNSLDNIATHAETATIGVTTAYGKNQGTI